MPSWEPSPFATARSISAKANLQHDLLRAAHRHQVRYLVGGIHFSEFDCSGKRLRARDATAQDDPVVGGPHLNLFTRQDFGKALLELSYIWRDPDLDVADQPAPLANDRE